MKTRLTTKAALGIASLVTLGLLGCSGMMVNVKDVDAKGAELTLKKGDEVKVATPKVEVKVKGDEGGKELAKLMQTQLTKELGKCGVEVAKDGDATLEVTISRYKKGCGFCRGFGNIGGLGNSFVDGEAVLKTPDGQRELIVAKKGQISGMAAMGDQTEQNVKLFASALANKICEDKGKTTKSQKDE